MDNDSLIKNSNSFFSEKDLKKLSTSAKWTTFLGILSIIAGAILAISAIVMLFVEPFISILYFLISIFSLYVGKYLVNFANGIKTFLKTENKEALSKAFAALNNYFQMNGMIAIIIITIYVFIIIGAIIIGEFSFLNF